MFSEFNALHMRTDVLIILLTVCAFPVTGQKSRPVINKTIPQKQILIISYCACTDGGDFTADSGEVIVPEQFRQSYIDARSKYAKLYGTTREQIAKRAILSGYRVSALRAATSAAWDSLFTPPKRNSQNPVSKDEDSAIQGSYWRRRYRIIGAVIGMDGPYPVFKIQKAVRIADVNYEEK
ncbi:hypothetical protein [Hymenobacter ruber]